MRSARFGLLLCTLLLNIPGGAQAPSSTPPQSSDPQAVAVVQAAITALGGATAIGQALSWTFKAEMRGPIVNDDVNYTITTRMAPVQEVSTLRGIRKRIPIIQSFFVPALLGSVLDKEVKDAEFSMSHKGTVTVNSKPCTVVTFSMSATAETTLPDQVWCFENATSLPVRVEFILPAEVGSSVAPPGIIDFEDYRFVSGVMYPFSINIRGQGLLPEIVTIQSVTPGTSAPSPEFNSSAGDIGR